jgi:hypothetical protein
MVEMAGDAGVIEDQQPAAMVAGGQSVDARGQFASRHGG